MKKLIPFIALVLTMTACERNKDQAQSDVLNSYINARIIGFDFNCSTCILEFPDDSANVREIIGKSPDNFYKSVNLSKGSYQAGQMLKVKIRKPQPSELRACITQYPSFNYKDIVVTEFEDYDPLVINDTVYLSYRECVNDLDNHSSLCFESVSGDSRCPTGVVCVWEGNASVRFRFSKNNESAIFFDLNTSHQFRRDITIDGYKITLLKLSPYPAINHPIDQKDYKAELLIEKK